MTDVVIRGNGNWQLPDGWIYSDWAEAVRRVRTPQALAVCGMGVVSEGLSAMSVDELQGELVVKTWKAALEVYQARHKSGQFEHQIVDRAWAGIADGRLDHEVFEHMRRLFGGLVGFERVFWNLPNLKMLCVSGDLEDATRVFVPQYSFEPKNGMEMLDALSVKSKWN